MLHGIFKSLTEGATSRLNTCNIHINTCNIQIKHLQQKCSNAMSRSDFATSASNTCNISKSLLQHHKIPTATWPSNARHSLKSSSTSGAARHGRRPELLRWLARHSRPPFVWFHCHLRMIQARISTKQSSRYPRNLSFFCGVSDSAVALPTAERLGRSAQS